MKKFIPILPLLLIVSCQPKVEKNAIEQNETSPAVEKSAIPVIDVSKPDDLVGQSAEKVSAACDAAQIPNRVISIDGKGLPVTMDYRSERLNFAVENGVITKVTKG